MAGAGRGGLQEGASQTCVGCRQCSSCCSPYRRETPKMGAENAIQFVQLSVSPSLGPADKKPS